MFAHTFIYNISETSILFHSKIEYVNRNGAESTIHTAMAVLCCCYSICRIVLVKQGEIGLTQNSDKPELLGPGRHVLLSPFNNFVGIRQVTDAVIQHGPLHVNILYKQLLLFNL